MFWKKNVLYRELEFSEFLCDKFQGKNSITSPQELFEVVSKLTGDEFLAQEAYNGAKLSSMQIRITPYVIAMINWDNFVHCPIRKQYISLSSELVSPTQLSKFDSLDERSSTPIPGLVHRYPNKVLLLLTSNCPSYCSYCTRSYSVGSSSDIMKKDKNVVGRDNLEEIIEYIDKHKIVDVLVSGGDIYYANHKLLVDISKRLLNLESVKRIRYATKSLAFEPSKFLSGSKLRSALEEINTEARKEFKKISIQVHFNHPRELNSIVLDFSNWAFSNCIEVRNQSVLLRGINNDLNTLIELNTKLSKMNINPYYIYVSDIVPGVEHLRTSIDEALYLQKNILGFDSGYCQPSFIVDLPSGGGKKPISLFDSYSNGVAVYSSPVIDNKRKYEYVDPYESINIKNVV